MFQSVRKYLWDRRKAVITFAGFVGGGWFLWGYLMARLEEMREKVSREHNAKEK
ncbi:hypothetical protein DL93DRAFT_2084611 [Clavulina sp. PMI_390]|nr:hypothetical protein DL93DRAFT_2084611 [Clavulina sp. PMI_390]